MDQEELRRQVAELHAELDQARRNNPAAGEHLSEILPHIQRLADGPQAGAADASLPDRLEQVAVQFAADHPGLAASARRLIELLGQAGI
jgi:hypothetical protein